MIEDAGADLASAERVAAFVKDRPVSFVLGGHIEMNSAGKLFAWESTYHPQERALPMTKGDLLELPAAIRNFNGIYTVREQFTMENSMRILFTFAALALIFLAAVAWLLIRLFLRWRRS